MLHRELFILHTFVVLSLHTFVVLFSTHLLCYPITRKSEALNEPACYRIQVSKYCFHSQFYVLCYFLTQYKKLFFTSTVY